LYQPALVAARSVRHGSDCPSLDQQGPDRSIFLPIGGCRAIVPNESILVGDIWVVVIAPRT
jgi:hypothetical protein